LDGYQELGVAVDFQPDKDRILRAKQIGFLPFFGG
jgi:hypothetical protein